LDLIDDEKFAKWWVEQRMSFRPKGKRILNYELGIKGIDRDIIEKVLSETQIDEAKTAKELLEKKLYRWKNLDRLKAQKKMSDFLARKGFEWEVIKNAIDLATKKK
jgi:regulatory protein